MMYLIAEIWVGLLVAGFVGVVLGHWAAALGRREHFMSAAARPPVPEADPEELSAARERATEAEARLAEAEAATAEAEANVAEAEAKVAEAELAAEEARGRQEEHVDRMHDAERRATSWEEKAEADRVALQKALDKLAARDADFDRLDHKIKDAVDLQEKLSSSRVVAVTEADLEHRRERDAAVAERDEAVGERDAAFLQRDAALDQRDVAVAARDEARAAGKEAVDRAARDAERIAELEMKLAARRAEVAEMSTRLQSMETQVTEAVEPTPELTATLPGPGGGAYEWAQSAAPESKGPMKGDGGMDYLVGDVEGIGPIFAARLAEAGVRDTSDLLDAARTSEGREALAKALKTSPPTVLAWAQQADLMRVDGVGPQYSELLRAADVHGVSDLAAADSAELTRRLEVANTKGRKRISGRVPDERSVAAWIASAALLTSRVQG